MSDLRHSGPVKEPQDRVRAEVPDDPGCNDHRAAHRGLTALDLVVDEVISDELPESMAYQVLGEEGGTGQGQGHGAFHVVPHVGVAAGEPGDHAVRQLPLGDPGGGSTHLLGRDDALDGGGDRDEIVAKLDDLLGQVKADDDARQSYVDLLEVLGPDDPRTAEYRKLLTRQLF